MAEAKHNEPHIDNEWELALVLNDWDAAIAEDRRRLKEAFQTFDVAIADQKVFGL